MNRIRPIKKTAQRTKNVHFIAILPQKTFSLHKRGQISSMVELEAVGSLKRRLPCFSILESVREHQAGLQSFRSMRRIEARRRKASALRLRFSPSLASLRQRLSHAMVRSTIQRLGKTTNSLT